MCSGWHDGSNFDPTVGSGNILRNGERFVEIRRFDEVVTTQRFLRLDEGTISPVSYTHLSVLTVLGEELRAYSQSKGALRFGIDDPLPKSVVERLVKVRLDQVSSTKT